MLNFKINEKPNHPKQRSLQAPNIDLRKRELTRRGRGSLKFCFSFTNPVEVYSNNSAACECTQKGRLPRPYACRMIIQLCLYNGKGSRSDQGSIGGNTPTKWCLPFPTKRLLTPHATSGLQRFQCPQARVRLFASVWVPRRV